MSEQSKTELSRLLSELSKKRRGGGLTFAASSILTPRKDDSALTAKQLSLGKPEGLSIRKDVSDELSSDRGINFGRPSSNPTPKQESNQFLEVAQRSAAGGLSKALGGGLLGALGGLGGLVSHVTSLFGGGNKAEAPLSLFQLPESTNQTISITSQKAETSPTQHYLSNPMGDDSTQDQSAFIVKVVKNALLTSSSLNDVISDL